MLPPLAYSVCVRALLDLAQSAQAGTLEIHFADEEGDPYAVALAGRLHAYVAGRDSDFLVLNSEGYQGYIPLDEMAWSATPPAFSRDPSMSTGGSVYSESAFGDAEEEDAGGFRTVRSAKSRKRAVASQHAGTGLIPPDVAELADATLSLAFTVYTPTVLAAHLELPVSLLPLLGALVGNDFTGAPKDEQGGVSGKQDLQRLFFERRLTPVQRITRAAGALRGILAAAFPVAQKKKRGKPVGSVIELIDAAVSALLLRADGLAVGEREAVVERVVEATLQYALPRYEGPDEGDTREGTTAWTSDVCALHTRETCPLLVMFSRSGQGNSNESHAASSVSDIDLDWATSVAEEPPTDAQVRVAELYLSAYRRGALDPHAVDAISSATSWPRLFLEDPDKESVVRSIGRPLREWGYALLDAGVLTGVEDAAGDIEEEDDDDDDDELVSVREDDEEDLLAPLRGALQQLDGAENATRSIMGSISSGSKHARPKFVAEYVRRGTRLAAEEVLVPPLADLLAPVADLGVDLSLPVQLWPPDTRLTLLLRLLRADSSHIRALQGERRMVVLAIRWVVQRMHARGAEGAGNKEREKERWTRTEAHAFLAAFAFSTAPGVLEDAEPVPLVERNTQLVAQVLAALGALEHLVQILLLGNEVPSPARYFSGRRVHSYLTGLQAAATLESGMWEACTDGLDVAFAEPRGPRGKKERRKKNVAPAPARGQTKAPANGGLFGLLASMDE